jgi:hypothetical protein
LNFSSIVNATINKYVRDNAQQILKNRSLLAYIIGDAPEPKEQKPAKPEPVCVNLIQELLMVRQAVPVPYEECCDSCRRPVSECGDLSVYTGWLHSAEDEFMVCDECSYDLAMEE